MSLGSIVAALLLSVGLAADATAAAVARGVTATRVTAGAAARLAILFGGFQAGMAAIGWLVGARVGAWFAAWDHWIAFVVLALLGGKAIRDGLRPAASPDPDADTRSLEPGAAALGWRALLPFAIATSIDALAAGVTLELVGPPVWLTLAAIGAVTAALSVVGLYAGRRAGGWLGHRVSIAGGAILIAIGVKILIEHLS